ncbi:signal peptide peptidase SppA [Candidatus Woesearchaeota archaeon]|nr:signal peptide peptidase SppA [Candidatus Woesearchaeota archaeon]
MNKKEVGLERFTRKSFSERIRESSTKKIFIIIFAIVVVSVALPLLFSSDSSEEKEHNGKKRGLGLPNVALIEVKGVLLTEATGGFSQQEVTPSLEIVNFIKEAEEDSRIQAIVLEINSPGGSPVASDEIATAMKEAKKPVIVFVRELGASGGYWVASAADYIIAHKMSLVGSIGVIGSYLEFSGSMEKYGIGYERLIAGKYKDSGSPFRKLTDEEQKIIQKEIDLLHTFFIQEVALNRNLDEDYVRELATGQVYLGVEAVRLGLIDELGDLNTVRRYLQETYGLEEIEFLSYKRQHGLLDILTGRVQAMAYTLGQGIGDRLGVSLTSAPEMTQRKVLLI